MNQNLAFLSIGPNVKDNVNDGVLQDVSNYPGFERDVYRAIKEHYYTTLNEPLIPTHMYTLMDHCSGRNIQE